MSPDARNRALIAALLTEAHQTGVLVAAAMDQNHRLVAALKAALQSPVQSPVQTPVKAPATSPDPAAEHRRNHRPGTLSRITRDPELEAFIRARIDTETLTAIIAEIAATFPPERRIGLSVLSRWWRKHAKPR